MGISQENKEENMKLEKIFVASPGNKDNGGGESLHQLVDSLNNMGYEAYIYYFDNMRDSVLEKMKIYNVKVARYIEDNEYNLLICPEMYTYPLKKYKKIQKAIWFLSLDYYLRSLPLYRTKFVSEKWKIPMFLFPVTLLAVLIKTDANFRTFSFKKDNVKYFLYNVEYAKQYIKQNCNGKYIAKYLCGPINEIYFMNESKQNLKEKIVVYNPKKSGEFNQKVIDAYRKKDSEVEFIPIKGLEQVEVKKILERAAVYIDFGFFPGPERIPREAVIMGCNIITSKLGSAGNNIDVPIDSKYKFELNDENIPHIVDLIHEMIYRYENYVQDFDIYRCKVIEQKKQFDLFVKDFVKSVEND